MTPAVVMELVLNQNPTSFAIAQKLKLKGRQTILDKFVTLT